MPHSVKENNYFNSLSIKNDINYENLISATSEEHAPQINNKWWDYADKDREEFWKITTTGLQSIHSRYM